MTKVKYYTKKELSLVIVLHSIFILMFLPAYFYFLIFNPSISRFYFFYIPILAFFVPVFTVLLQQKLHHKYGILIILSFLIDLMLVISILAYLLPQTALKIRNNTNIFENLTPFYFLLISTVLLFISHLEIFKRSFKKYHKVKILFLNPPLH